MNRSIFSFLITLLVSSMLLSAAPATASEDDTLGIFGNANMDGTIDGDDVAYLEGIIDGTNYDTKLADANCDGQIDEDDITQIELIIAGEEDQFIILDDAGNPSTLAMPIQRIIVLSADCSEVIRCFGIDDRIIAVDSYTAEDINFFPKFADLPTVGSSFHPDCEAIIELNPDIVFAYTSVNEEELEDKLEPAGIPVVRFSTCKVPTRDIQLRTIGYILGEDAKAEEIIEFYNGITNPLAEALDDLSDGEKPRVYIECYKEYRARNQRSGTHPMVEMAGGINIAQDLDPLGSGTTFEVDPEWIIEQNPEIIIKVVSGSTVSCGYDLDDSSQMKLARDEIVNRPGFENIDAIKNGRVYLISSHICDRSCNAIGIAYLAKWFYPELFEDLDPQTIHQKYLTRFQGLDYDLDKHGVFVYPPLEVS
jgi:iron complex transport system substrate-binding protein